MIPFADKEPASKLEAPSTKHSALNVHFTSKDSAVRLSLKELLLEAKKFRVALRSWENVPWIRSLTKSPEQSLSINYSSRHYDQETRLVLKGGKFYAEEDVPTPGMKWATQPKLFALTQRSKLTSLVLNGLDMRVVADSLQEHALAQGVEPNPSLTIPAHLNRNVENIVPSFALESNVGIQALFPLKVQPQLELRRVDNAENEEHYEALPVARSDRELNWQYRKPSGESPVQDIRDLKGPSRWLADKIGVFKQPVFLSHFKAHSTAVPALYQAWTAQELVDLMPLQRMTEACHSPTKEDRTLRFSFPRFEILIQDGSLTIEERNQPTIFCPYEYGSLEYDDFYSSDLRSDLGKLIGSLKSIQHPEEKLHQFVAGLLELDDKIITTATLSDAQSTAAEMIDFVLSSTVPIYCKPMNSCQGNGILKVTACPDGNYLLESNCPNTTPALRNYQTSRSSLLHTVGRLFQISKQFVGLRCHEYEGAKLTKEEAVNFLETKYSSDWIAEQEIIGAKLNNMLLEIRLCFNPLAIDSTHSKHSLTGHYAKLSKAKVTGNLSQVGFGRETLATLVDLYEDRFPDFSKEETTRLARESMSDLFSKAEVFLELWLGACATLQESTYDRAAPFSTEHGFNQGIAIDLRPRWQPNSSMLEWYLMEVNASDQQQHKEIGISGLKSANPYLESFTSFRSSHGYRELRVPS